MNSELGLWALIGSDIRRKQQHYVLVNRFFNRYVKVGLQHGTLAVIVYRIGHWAHTRRSPWSRSLGWLVYGLLRLPVGRTSGVWINPCTPIGPGFVIHNFSNVVIDAECIGRSLTINQGVTVGPDWRLGARPRLGDNAFLGSGAKVLGDVDIGNDVVVAANALVVKPVKDRCLVAGVPAFVIKRDIPSDYVATVAATRG